MDVMIFKDSKKNDGSHYWFVEGIEGDRKDKDLCGYCLSFEDTLILIGREMILKSLKLDRIMYEGRQINKQGWN